MKSQVNALLQVVRGLLRDAQVAYPALEDGLSKDFDRLALYCQTRGIGFFTLDLPHLESLLLQGLEVGRLALDGPLSQRVSKEIHVPRLYAGLWLRVFDRQANLKQDADVTALAFLRQLLVVGKKLELGCSYDRLTAVVGAYHDIEHKLRRPNLGWEYDSLGLDDTRTDDCFSDHQLGGLFPLSDSPVPGEEEEKEVDYVTEASEGKRLVLSTLGLAQAAEVSYENPAEGLALFGGQGSIDGRRRKKDVVLLNQIQRVADLIVGSFETFDPILYSENLEREGRGTGFKHGPGAVAERRKNWEKSQFPNWPAKLQTVFPFELCGRTAGSDGDTPPNHEVASRLIAVPKTTKGPRLIAAEPTAHQWCQQAVLSFLFNQCRRSFGTDFIDFKDQQKSGDMVLEASKSRQLATVDLSDASDRLTCWTVERIFRSSPSILLALHAARTRYIRDDISEYPSFLSLRKFASQGTAVTFPVMSITMLCIAIGASLSGPVTWSAIGQLRNQVRVFGDDIILPVHGYARLARAMELLQLKINVAKSYTDSYFRESCGTDGYKGYDVTPTKPRTLVADSPASCQAVVDTTNNLFNKGYWHAASACFDLLPLRIQRRLRVVGRNDTGFRGVTSFCGSDESHLRRRWNSRLHRYEVETWTTYNVAQGHRRDGFSALLDFFASKHSSEQARTVSEYADIRKTRSGLRWEPSSHSTHGTPEWPQIIRRHRR